MLDVRQTPQYARFMSQTGWSVEKANGIYCYIRKIPILGNFIKIQRPKKILTEQDINILRDKYKPFQIIIEPVTNHQSLVTNHFRQSKSPFVPSKTLHIDVTVSKMKLFNQLKKDARYALRKAQNSKLVDIKHNLELFHSSWKAAVPFDRYVISLDHLQKLQQAFGDKSLFLLSQDNSSGAFFIRSSDTAYYWQAFTNKAGRSSQIQYKVVWEGILWAKRSGCKVFDFEGIYDARFPNKKWLGFTHFKKSFGGVEVEYPGAYSRTYFFNR